MLWKSNPPRCTNHDSFFFFWQPASILWGQALFLSLSRRERFSYLTRGCWADSLGVYGPEDPGTTMWPTSLASAASPRTHNFLCEVHGNISHLQILSQNFGIPQFDFGNTHKVERPQGRRPIIQGTIWPLIKLQDPRPRSAPPPSGCLTKEQASTYSLDSPKPLATNRSGYLCYSTIVLFTKLITHF